MGRVLEKNKERLILKKNWVVWKKLAGIWKNKKIEDPVKWQRKIRKDRKLP